MSKATQAVTTAGTQATSASFPYLAIVSIIFVVAKILGHFPYSWWIVFLPMYAIPVAFFGTLLVLLAVAGIVVGIVFLASAVIEYLRKQRPV